MSSHDIASQIASESISEDQKSQMFHEEHAPRPPFTELPLQTQILDRTL